jgi:hypothetical protein
MRVMAREEFLGTPYRRKPVSIAVEIERRDKWTPTFVGVERHRRAVDVFIFP